MHGPGYPPQNGHRPSSGSVVALRVLFALLPILSCGFLAWGSMLRIALLTRKSRDWALLALSVVLCVAWVVLIGADPTPNTDGWQGNTGAGGTLITAFVTCVYFLVADIRHHEAAAPAGPGATGPWYPAQNAPYSLPQQQQTVPSYGYPSAQPNTPPPVTPPQHTPPPRIGQVRAELDELSELLRKQTPHPSHPPQPQQPPRPGGPYRDPNDTAIQDRDQ